MYYEINKEAIDAMMSAPGEVRGEFFMEDRNFVLERGGKEKLRQVEGEVEALGYPFSYNKIKSKDYYPWGRKVLSLLAVSSVFSMDKKGVEEMGISALRKSTTERFFARRFSNIEQTFQQVSKKWRKNHTIGRLEVAGVDEEKKEVVLRLYNINFHPIFCDYMCGYFSAVAKMVKGKTATCEEAKCYFKGESFFHEFLLKWE